MSFFQSDIVQEELKEISILQEKIYQKVWEFPSMTSNDKLEHVEMLEDLLNRQRVLYTRMSLSDDPAAVGMKKQILEQAKQLGFPPDVDLAYVFGNMTQIIDNMKKSLRD